MPYRKLVIDFDKVYNSNSCGPFKIIKDLGRDERSRRKVRIKFINTGTEKDIRYDLAEQGRVRDDLYGIDFDTTYNSLYYGPYKIIAYLGRNSDSDRMVRVRFLNTGYEYDVVHDSVKKGFVRDHSVSYHDRKVTASTKEEYDVLITNILKSRWRAMMTRCYSETSQSYENYGEYGITVCEYWHNIDNFLKSVPNLKNFDRFYNDPTFYQLDKDYLQQDIPRCQRIYSPETCVFLSIVDNANLSIKENHSSDEYYGIKQTPDGNYQVIFSIDNHKIDFGTYSNLTAALNEYNFYYIAAGRFQLVPLLNHLPEHMTHLQALKYLVKQ